MVVVPAVVPDTMPLAEPTVATAVVPLIHVPPEVALESVVADPAHMLIVPVSGAGTAFTVTVCVV